MLHCEVICSGLRSNRESYKIILFLCLVSHFLIITPERVLVPEKKKSYISKSKKNFFPLSEFFFSVLFKSVPLGWRDD